MTEAAPETGADTGATPPATTENAQAAATPATPAPAAKAAPPDWRESIPEDLRSNPSIAKFMTAKDQNEFTGLLAKSYVNASSMIGRDKVPIPKEGESWDDFWKAAGRPDTADGYEFKAPDGLPEGFYDEASAETFRGWAHEAGLSKSQAAAMHDNFVKMTAEQAQAVYSETMAKLEQGKQALKSEWGNAFDAKLQAAARVAREIGGEDFAEYLEETGMGNDPRFIKALAKVAEITKGDADLIGQGQDQVMTPLQLDGEIARFRDTHNAALMDKYHSGHDAAVAGLEALYKKRFPPKDVA